MPSDQWKREVEHVMGAGSMVEAERQLDALDAQAERIEALEAERNSQDYRITAITADGDRLFAETTRLSERIAALEAAISALVGRREPVPSDVGDMVLVGRDAYFALVAALDGDSQK